MTKQHGQFSLFGPLFSVLFVFIVSLTACSSTQANKTDLNQEESIAQLIAAGRTDEVKARFSSTDSIHQKNSKGQSLLHLAALQNDAELIRFLLSMKANTESKDSAGETPLASAVNANTIAAITALAEGNASIFAKNAVGATVYSLARTQGKETFTAVITEITARQQDSNGLTALHNAIIDGDESNLRTILNVSKDISIPDSKGITPLGYAYQNANNPVHASLAAQLLLAGAEPLRKEFTYFETAILKRNLSIRFEEGKTPLHLASEYGHTGFVSYLLNQKVPVNVKDIASSTPLHTAVRNGFIDCTLLLLKAGADTNQKDSSGNTPLHMVMPVASRSQIFKELLRAGADPNQKDSYGETPLHISARLGMSDDIIRSLVTAGADTNERNKKGVTPLSLAIDRKQMTQARLFVELGADIHAEDIDSNTAVRKAISAGLEMAQSVILPSNIQTRDSWGRTPLHVAVLNNANPDIISYFISIKADVNARDKNGDTPLHITVRNNDRANGEILLAYGADVFYPNVSGESALKAALTRMGGRQDWMLNSNVIKSVDGAGNTPLHLAAEWQLTSIVSLIAEKGGDMNARNANGETPLFNAVKSDSGVTIKAMLTGMLDKKADINARDFLGNTALHACIRWAAPMAAENLLSFDAQNNGKKLINARNLAGKTALHEAARTGNLNFMKMLLNSAADINASDETGKTPLSDAIQVNRKESVVLLLERKASPVMQDMYGRNAYHEAVEYSTPDIITLISAAGGNPMSRDSFGRTPLSLAFRKNAETVLAVIGSNRNLVDSDGNTPLHIAVSEHSSAQTLQELIASNFPINNRNRTGTTALLLAVRNGQKESARILLASNADPFATDNSGESAASISLMGSNDFVELLAEFSPERTDTIGDGLLHYAARLSNTDVVKRLLSLPRIDRSARNVAGETAYDIAIRWQRMDIANLLK